LGHHPDELYDRCANDDAFKGSGVNHLEKKEVRRQAPMVDYMELNPA
jgi:hypothetical protein